jgi:alkanesulfonate monooxygenase SsuD/methylene tetrahydromethanopterin reductase-like flavin-dependent oxidoreductase (luciferase family)
LLAAQGFGYEASPYQMGHLIPIYVAETDARAKEEAADHALWLYHKGLRHKQEFLFPPGYVTAASMRRILGIADDMDWGKMSFDELNEKGFCVVGSVETVRQRLSAYVREIGFGVLLSLLQFGDMPYHRTVKNMELFATEVMPVLKEEFKGMQEKWAKAA